MSRVQGSGTTGQEGAKAFAGAVIGMFLLPERPSVFEHLVHALDGVFLRTGRTDLVEGMTTRTFETLCYVSLKYAQVGHTIPQIEELGNNTVDCGFDVDVQLRDLTTRWMDAQAIVEHLHSPTGNPGVPMRHPALPSNLTGRALIDCFSATAAALEKVFASGGIRTAGTLDLSAVQVWTIASTFRSIPGGRWGQGVDGLRASGQVFADLWGMAKDAHGSCNPRVDQICTPLIMQRLRSIPISSADKTYAKAALIDYLTLEPSLMNAQATISSKKKEGAVFQALAHCNRVIKEVEDGACDDMLDHRAVGDLVTRAIAFANSTSHRILLSAARGWVALKHAQELTPGQSASLEWLVDILDSLGENPAVKTGVLAPAMVGLRVTSVIGVLRHDSSLGVPPEMIAMAEMAGMGPRMIVRMLELLGHDLETRKCNRKSLSRVEWRFLRGRPPRRSEQVVHERLLPMVACETLYQAVLKELLLTGASGDVRILDDGPLTWWFEGPRLMYLMSRSQLESVHTWARANESSLLTIRLSSAVTTSLPMRRAALGEAQHIMAWTIEQACNPNSSLGAANRAMFDVVQLSVCHNTGAMPTHINKARLDCYADGPYEARLPEDPRAAPPLVADPQKVFDKGLAADLTGILPYIRNPPEFVHPAWDQSGLLLPWSQAGAQPVEELVNINDQYLPIMLNILKLFRGPPVAPMHGSLGTNLMNSRQSMTWLKFPAHRYLEHIWRGSQNPTVTEIMASTSSSERALMAYNLGVLNPTIGGELPVPVSTLPLPPLCLYAYRYDAKFSAALTTLRYGADSSLKFPLVWAMLRSLTHDVGNDEQVYPCTLAGVTEPMGMAFADYFKKQYGTSRKSLRQVIPVRTPRLIVDDALIDLVYFDDPQRKAEILAALAAYNQDPDAFLQDGASNKAALAYGHPVFSTIFFESQKPRDYLLMNDKKNSHPDTSTYFSSAKWTNTDPESRQIASNSIQFVANYCDRPVGEIIASTINDCARCRLLELLFVHPQVVSTAQKYEAHKFKKPRAFTMPSIMGKYVLRLCQECFNRGLNNMTGNTMGVSVAKLNHESAAISSNTGAGNTTKCVASTDMASFSTMMPAFVVGLQQWCFTNLFPSRETSVFLASVETCRQAWATSPSLPPNLQRTAAQSISFSELEKLQEDVLDYAILHNLPLIPVVSLRSNPQLQDRCIPFTHFPTLIPNEIAYVHRAVSVCWVVNRAGGVLQNQMKFDGCFEGFFNGLWTMVHIATINGAVFLMNHGGAGLVSVVGENSYAIAFSDDGAIRIYLMNQALAMQPDEAASLAISRFQDYTIAAGFELSPSKTIVCTNGFVFLNTICKNGGVLSLPLKSCMNIHPDPVDQFLTPKDRIDAVHAASVSACQEGLEETTAQVLENLALEDAQISCLFPDPHGPSFQQPSETVAVSRQSKLWDAFAEAPPSSYTFPDTDITTDTNTVPLPSWIARSLKISPQALAAVASISQNGSDTNCATASGASKPRFVAEVSGEVEEDDTALISPLNGSSWGSSYTVDVEGWVYQVTATMTGHGVTYAPTELDDNEVCEDLPAELSDLADKLGNFGSVLEGQQRATELLGMK